MLAEFNVGDNKLTGRFPELLTTLIKLSEFLLACSNVIWYHDRGLIDLLLHTETLDIGPNGISGLVPTTLGQLTDLGKIVALSEWNTVEWQTNPSWPYLIPEVLDLGRNSLSGTIPSELGLLEKLGTYCSGHCLHVTPLFD